MKIFIYMRTCLSSNKNNNSLVCQYNIPVLMILIYFFVLTINTACTNMVDFNKGVCLLNNKDNLKYFDSFNKELDLLKESKYLSRSILTPLCIGYNIPSLNLVSIDHNDDKIYRSPSICPPDILHGIDYKSCLKKD